MRSDQSSWDKDRVGGHGSYCCMGAAILLSQHWRPRIVVLDLTLVLQSRKNSLILSHIGLF